jgi:hypothetical protein
MSQSNEILPGRDISLREHKKRVAMQTEALLVAYRKNFPDSTVDDNDAINLAFLRWDHLSPIEVVREEFDSYIPEERLLESVSKGQFLNDLQKIKTMSSAERKLLIEECRLDKYPMRFVIDTVSLANTETGRYGHHGDIERSLLEHLKLIRGLEDCSKEQELELASDLIWGKIYTEIRGFIAPIIRFDNKNFPLSLEKVQKLRRVGEYLIGQGVFIPLDASGKLINKDYKAGN